MVNYAQRPGGSPYEGGTSNVVLSSGNKRNKNTNKNNSSSQTPSSISEAEKIQVIQGNPNDPAVKQQIDRAVIAQQSAIAARRIAGARGNAQAAYEQVLGTTQVEYNTGLAEQQRVRELQNKLETGRTLQIKDVVPAGGKADLTNPQFQKYVRELAAYDKSVREARSAGYVPIQSTNQGVKFVPKESLSTKGIKSLASDFVSNYGNNRNNISSDKLGNISDTSSNTSGPNYSAVQNLQASQRTKQEEISPSLITGIKAIQNEAKKYSPLALQAGEETYNFIRPLAKGSFNILSAAKDITFGSVSAVASDFYKFLPGNYFKQQSYELGKTSEFAFKSAKSSVANEDTLIAASTFVIPQLGLSKIQRGLLGASFTVPVIQTAGENIKKGKYGAAFVDVLAGVPAAAESLTLSPIKIRSAEIKLNPVKDPFTGKVGSAETRKIYTVGLEAGSRSVPLATIQGSYPVRDILPPSSSIKYVEPKIKPSELLASTPMPESALAGKSLIRVLDLSPAEKSRVSNVVDILRLQSKERGLDVPDYVVNIKELKNRERVTDLLKDFQKANQDAVIFGSFGTKNLGETFANKKPGDIDIVLKGRANDNLGKIKDFYEGLVKAGEDVALSSEGNIIEFRQSKNKFLEFKFSDEPEFAVSPSDVAPEGVLGFRFPSIGTRRVQFGPGYAITAGEQLARKAAGTLILSPGLKGETPSFSLPGILGKQGNTRGLKDVAGFLQSSSGISEIQSKKGIFSSFVGNRATTLRESFLKTYTKEQQKDIRAKFEEITEFPLVLDSDIRIGKLASDKSPFGRYSVSSLRNVKIPEISPSASLKRISPSISSFSRSSISSFKSPSLSSLSRIGSPSPYTSKSPSISPLSPSTYPSLSPSTFSPSPSITSPSPYSSPSPYISPSPSIYSSKFVSPPPKLPKIDGRFSRSTKKQNIKVPTSKLKINTKYTPTLFSLAFNIKGKSRLGEISGITNRGIA